MEERLFEGKFEDELRAIQEYEARKRKVWEVITGIKTDEGLRKIIQQYPLEPYRYFQGIKVRNEMLCIFTNNTLYLGFLGKDYYGLWEFQKRRDEIRVAYDRTETSDRYIWREVEETDLDIIPKIESGKIAIDFPLLKNPERLVKLVEEAIRGIIHKR